jgi:hypothetical protein
MLMTCVDRLPSPLSGSHPHLQRILSICMDEDVAMNRTITWGRGSRGAFPNDLNHPMYSSIKRILRSLQ